ncbi:MAG: methyltransferase domain-containing protein [Candidatus Thermoplasmatota archaeon]|nr:methyltransferase domain-containing protein [Candidatus Thermoplasmatota archaeon]
MNKVQQYIKFYSTPFGKKILDEETHYVEKKLRGRTHVLSIGCGPALLEAQLQWHHPEMTVIGLDRSKEMITQASHGVTLVYGDAEHLEFKDESFDAVVYVTALEFIENTQHTIQEAHRVLRKNGLLLVLLLNTHSRYYQEKYSDTNSYIRKNKKHTNTTNMKSTISHYFSITTEEYFLGILDHTVTNTSDRAIASLYVIEGEKG